MLFFLEASDRHAHLRLAGFLIILSTSKIYIIVFSLKALEIHAWPMLQA
jgi:hypothetical protein